LGATEVEEALYKKVEPSVNLLREKIGISSSCGYLVGRPWLITHIGSPKWHSFTRDKEERIAKFEIRDEYL
jgi:hypothetical protein